MKISVIKINNMSVHLHSHSPLVNEKIAVNIRKSLSMLYGTVIGVSLTALNFNKIIKPLFIIFYKKGTFLKTYFQLLIFKDNTVVIVKYSK